MSASYLLDTCAFIWLADGGQLGEAAERCIFDEDSELYLSAASVWEMATKYAIGRLKLPDRPEKIVSLLRDGYQLSELPIDYESALRSASLPPIHQDPFDRMLIAQSVTHALTILTPDEHIRRYAVRTVW